MTKQDEFSYIQFGELSLNCALVVEGDTIVERTN